MLSVSGCATDGPAPSDYCLNTKFIYLAPDDRLTRRTEDQIFAHNETRAAICGMTP